MGQQRRAGSARAGDERPRVKDGEREGREPNRRVDDAARADDEGHDVRRVDDVVRLADGLEGHPAHPNPDQRTDGRRVSQEPSCERWQA
jgi:hypothetical protein